MFCSLFPFSGHREIDFRYFSAEDREEKQGRFGVGIKDVYQHNLVEVRADSKEAVFEITGGPDKGQQHVEKFDVLLATPRSEPLAVVKQSDISDLDGFVDVDMETFQHVKHNVATFNMLRVKCYIERKLVWPARVRRKASARNQEPVR